MMFDQTREYTRSSKHRADIDVARRHVAPPAPRLADHIAPWFLSAVLHQRAFMAGARCRHLKAIVCAAKLGRGQRAADHAADQIGPARRCRGYAWRLATRARKGRRGRGGAQIGTHTPVLGHEGADLAAALQTIREIGDPVALNHAVPDAFPGATLAIEGIDGRFETTMRQHGLLRPLRAMEFSDGTLCYLLWIAALLTLRPPQLLVLNEPETSLHPDLLPALGRLIAQGAQHAQVFVVSHAPRLIASLHDAGCQTIALEKELGETRVRRLEAFERPAWRWVSR
jgi:hypothetical protein